MCRGFGRITKMSDPHAPIALQPRCYYRIRCPCIPISIGGTTRLFRAAIAGIVFNLSRRRGAHPRVPRKVFHRKFLRRSIPISSLFLASFHLISSYREEQLCRFLCEIHLTHRIDRCDIHYAYLFVGEVKCAK